ncbi:MAG: Tn3 family transposase, partial [Candidatus Dormibacteraceae bacterium]
FEATGWGDEVSLDQVWGSIEAVVPRAELRAAVAAIFDIAPPAAADPDGEWRAELVDRIATVRGFLPRLTEVIDFDASAEGVPVLQAMRELPTLLAAKPTKRIPAGQLAADRIVDDLVAGSWRRLVYRPDLPEGVVDRPAYVFCILEQFHRHLRRRDIYATASTRWRDPRAQLLAGAAWENARGPTLTALQLPERPDELLAEHAQAVNATYRDVAAHLAGNAAASVDEEGRLHVERIQAVPDLPSLVDLRRRVEGMLPSVDLPEIVLEVMTWEPGFVDAFTSVSGGEPRLTDLHVTIAAVLTAHALNLGYGPIVQPGRPPAPTARSRPA